MLIPYSTKHTYMMGRSDKLFTERRDLLSFYQEIAENFCPERATFTFSAGVSQAYASDLATSFPLLVQRDLSNSFSAMLRPAGTEWFEMKTNRPDDSVDVAGREYLEHASKIQRNAMSDRVARFDRATKEGDRDFSAFGQCVLSAEFIVSTQTLLYRCWHLRDVAWCEDAKGEIYFITRKWETTAADLVRLYGIDGVSPKVKELATANQGINAWDRVLVRHIVCSASEFEVTARTNAGPSRLPWVSILIEEENNFVLEEYAMPTRYYIIPRWMTLPGSQYAMSPAVICGLPDARLLQAQAYTLLRAGQKMVDPPTIGIAEQIRGDMALYPGGHTWVDSQYEGKLEDVLRPVGQDTKSFPVGFNMQQDVRDQLSAAFYLNKLSLPPRGPEMTAEEARYRVQQYIREATPLFQPIEAEYNGQVCDDTFILIMANGGFGPRDNIPESLRGSEVRFKFRSPLLDAEDQELPRIMIDSKALAMAAAELDPAAAEMLNAQKMLRDALRGRGAPAPWVKDEDAMSEITAQVQQQQAVQKQLAAAGNVAQVAEQGGKAAQAMVQADQTATGDGEDAAA